MGIHKEPNILGVGLADLAAVVPERVEHGGHTFTREDVFDHLVYGGANFLEYPDDVRFGRITGPAAKAAVLERIRDDLDAVLTSMADSAEDLEYRGAGLNGY